MIFFFENNLWIWQVRFMLKILIFFISLTQSSIIFNIKFLEIFIAHF